MRRQRIVEKLRKGVDILGDSRTIHALENVYCAPKRTDTSFETPGSCMVTP